MPLAIVEGRVIKRRAPKNQKPTIRQIKTLQNIAMGMSKRQAMLKAGYTPASVRHHSAGFFRSRAIKNAIETILNVLEKKGLDTDFYTDKIIEFSNATKIHSSHTEPDVVVPDYSTQIQGIKIYEKLREKAEEKNSPLVKRKITFEEFVTGKEDLAPK